MTENTSSKPSICEEVFDDRSQPSDEEIREFAIQIGIDPTTEPHLLPIARDGLMRPLPKNWKPVYDNNLKRFYYFNFKTKLTSWEHPLDSKFRQLVKKSRSESLSSAGDDDSKTSVKEELKSFEETATSFVSETYETFGNLKEEEMNIVAHQKRPTSAHGLRGNASSGSTLRPLRQDAKSDPDSLLSYRQSGAPIPRVLPPAALSFGKLSSQFGKDNLSFEKESHILKTSKSLSLMDRSKKHEVLQSKIKLDQNSDMGDRSMPTSTIGRFTVDKVSKIDIDKQLRRLDQEYSEDAGFNSEKSVKIAQLRPELTLSGGGSIFLKSNQKKTENSSKDSSFQLSNYTEEIKNNSLSVPDISDFSLGVGELIIQDFVDRDGRNEVVSPSPSSLMTRSILRTPLGESPLWDLDPQNMSSLEKKLWKQQELEEEKKSVRFNLDEKLNISFNLSDSSESEGNMDEPDEVSEWNSGDESNHDEERKQRDLGDESGRKCSSSTFRRGSNEVSYERLDPVEDWTWSRKSDPTMKTYDLESKEPSLINAPLTVSNDAYQAQDKTVAFEEGKIEQDSMTIASEHHHDPTAPPKDESMKETLTPHGVSALSPSVTQFDLDSSDVTSLKDNLPIFPTSPLQDPENVVTVYGNVLSLNSRKSSEKSVNERTELITKKARERDQALRDWNVKPGDSEKLSRPSLSRQQSQQQFQQIKQLVPEPAKLADRDRALREWNVTADTANPSSVSKNDDGSFETGKSGEDALNESNGSENITAPFCNNAFESDVPSLKNEDESQIETLEEKFNRSRTMKEQEYKLKLENFEKETMLKFEDEVEKQRRNQEKKEKEMKGIASRLERESEARLNQLKEQLEHKQKCAIQELQEIHQQVLAAQEVENQAAMLRIREQHAADMKSLREQLLKEEEQIRTEHVERILNVDDNKDTKRSKEAAEQSRTKEKLRCEKHLLENKYRTLKEKYIKLKSEVKMNAEKKDQKLKADHPEIKDHEQKTSNVPDQDTSSTQSQSQLPSDRSSQTNSKVKTASSSFPSSSLGFRAIHPITANKTEEREQQPSYADIPSPVPDNNNSFCNGGQTNKPIGTGSHPFFLAANEENAQMKIYDPSKSVHDSSKVPWCKFFRSNDGEENGNSRKIGGGNAPETSISSHQDKNKERLEYPKHPEKLRNLTPLEALRHQLRTLDELEEQFPASSLTDTYLRYPFSDSASNRQLKSAELEFFRHRVHLERDMVRKAKSSLRAQQSEYRTRLRDWTVRQSSSPTIPSATLYQMSQEEQELSDLEANLQKTRTLLSEKIVRLRHLEKSLENFSSTTFDTSKEFLPAAWVETDAAEGRGTALRTRRWDWKVGAGLLSAEDVNDEASSDSGGSSGFSSTEHASDSTLASLLSQRTDPRRKHKKPDNDGADINTSISNLNSEISEIWNVLCQQRTAAGLGPPPLLHPPSRSWFDTDARQSPSIAYGCTPASSTQVMPDKSSLVERTNNLRQWLQKAKTNASLSPHVDLLAD